MLQKTDTTRKTGSTFKIYENVDFIDLFTSKFTIVGLQIKDTTRKTGDKWFEIRESIYLIVCVFSVVNFL